MSSKEMDELRRKVSILKLGAALGVGFCFASFDQLVPSRLAA